MKQRGPAWLLLLGAWLRPGSPREQILNPELMPWHSWAPAFYQGVLEERSLQVGDGPKVPLSPTLLHGASACPRTPRK